ncbi:hypothetical protein TrLO_g4999 [Triparma laevis f. longispina]|uniref:Uncharacterized protein n=1 Tax=Triparma laevis f. longispina TaxID=1714387 RepID=A0A9W7AIP4_9STRA|nr:hypothetical protein TrLO_g4999 [Triparma laevis f. longispina]
MRMTSQSGFCINADCTETMNGTFVENPWTNAMYNAAKDTCDVYHDQNMPWIDWAILTQGLLAMCSLLLRFILIIDYSNKYTDSSVTLFVDLFLLFVFAKIVDHLFNLISMPFFNAVKGEIKEFDEATR